MSTSGCAQGLALFSRPFVNYGPFHQAYIEVKRACCPEAKRRFLSSPTPPARDYCLSSTIASCNPAPHTAAVRPLGKTTKTASSADSPAARNGAGGPNHRRRHRPAYAWGPGRRTARRPRRLAGTVTTSGTRKGTGCPRETFRARSGSGGPVGRRGCAPPGKGRRMRRGKGRRRRRRKTLSARGWAWVSYGGVTGVVLSDAVGCARSRPRDRAASVWRMDRRRALVARSQRSESASKQS